MLALKHLADFFFPLSCLSCETEGTLLCDRCARNLPKKTALHCPNCQAVTTPYGALCHACRGKSPLDGIFAATSFRDPLVKKVIHAYKYSFGRSLAIPLGHVLGNELQKTPLPLPDMILFFPLHEWRERWRGFNQAELLAEALAEMIAPELKLLPEKNPLIRRHFTLPQSRQKNKIARKENLSGAFILDPNTEKDFFRGKRVWLIDDVATTGSTLTSCAAILKRRGAAEVRGITVAS
jgi:ComF family protein